MSQKVLQAIGISSSPSANSRSRILVARTLEYLTAKGVETRLIDLSELSAEALLARSRDAVVDAAIQQATQADILVLGTPVYRTTYTGQLKVFLDLFPQDSLKGRVAGLIATGASPAHALAVDYGLRSLVASLQGLSASQALYVTDSQIPDKSIIPPEIDYKVKTLVQELHLLARGLQETD